MSSSCHWHAELRRLTAFWRRLQVSVGEALESAPAIDTAMMDLNRTGIVRPPPPVPPSFPLPKGPSVSWVLLVATAVGIKKTGADNNFWWGGRPRYKQIGRPSTSERRLSGSSSLPDVRRAGGTRTGSVYIRPWAHGTTRRPVSSPRGVGGTEEGDYCYWMIVQ